MRGSHYFKARLSAQFDWMIHIDRTRALPPLGRGMRWDHHELLTANMKLRA